MGKVKERGKVGDNSDKEKRNDEFRKIAKAQRLLDNEKAATQADWRKRHKALTARLVAIESSRQAFAQPYANFCRIANAENDDDAKRAAEDNKMYLAQQREAYDALSPNEQIDWINLVQDAEKLRKDREEAEREREAADNETEEAEKNEQ